VQIEPDILIVDEALAVGDALFQKRCFQQIEKLVSNGTSLLFVSHDQEAMRTLTHHALLLTHGVVRARGLSAEVLLEYRRQLHEDEAAYFKATNADTLTKPSTVTDRFSFGDGEAQVIAVTVLDAQGQPCSLFHPGDAVTVRVECLTHIALDHLNIALRIRSKEGIKVYSWGTLNQDISINNGQMQGEIFWGKKFTAGQRISVDFHFVCRLGTNLYEIQAAISREGKLNYSDQKILHWRDEAAFFHVIVKDHEYFFGGAFDMQMQARF